MPSRRSMTGEQKRLERCGKVLTWLAGIAGALVAMPVLVLGCFMASIGSSINEYGAGFGCHTEECAREATAAAIGAYVFVVFVVVLIVLAAWSSRRALILATALSLAIAVGFTLPALASATGRIGWEAGGLLLIVATIAGVLALGSALRLRARTLRPRS